MTADITSLEALITVLGALVALLVIMVPLAWLADWIGDKCSDRTMGPRNPEDWK